MNKDRNENLYIVILTLICITAFAGLFYLSSRNENPLILEKERQENAKIFCAQGRQWIEFQSGAATWGAMVLDYEGKPVRCNTILEPRFTKG